jgi:glycerol-3-phosphate dehydrogenase (NAD(P)+)
MSKVTVLGAGAFGTALAVLLVSNGHSVTLGVRRNAQLETLRANQENNYLPGVRLPKELELSSDWPAAVAESQMIVMAVPSRYTRATIAPMAHTIPSSATLISVTKGIEQDSLLTMSQLLAELAPQVKRIAVLSGPGFAAEIARGKPAALVAAADEETVASEVQRLFASPIIRAYRSRDVLGVELGGAVKNVIAIASGVSDGLELGASARAALITRGVAEIMRLAEAAGAKSETIAGLAGLGDLILTCTGDLSRNRRTGLAIAHRKPISAEATGAPVAEGIANAESVWALAHRLNVEMPIVSAVHRVLYEKAPALAMVEELLSRELKAEFRQ